MAPNLEGRVALVAGGTCGAGCGIAVELGAAGATVYVTGRTTREQSSEYGRPETIEETAELVDGVGGRGIAVRVDHLEADQVRDLVRRIEGEQGRLDVLVNDVWGGEYLAEWEVPVWEHSLEGGLRMQTEPQMAQRVREARTRRNHDAVRTKSRRYGHAWNRTRNAIAEEGGPDVFTLEDDVVWIEDQHEDSELSTRISPLAYPRNRARLHSGGCLGPSRARWC